MDALPVPQDRTLTAPGSWRCIDLLSDLHLQSGDPDTAGAWRRHMATTPADAVIILGDLFEAWPGDDAAQEPGFEADCADVLRQAARSRAVYLMHGNRDFLLGRALLDGCGVQLLPDPTVLGFMGQRWLLSHGDLLCLDDADYLRFRAEVRDPRWQQAVLARPLAERRALARSLRARSEARHLAGEGYADVDDEAARAWLRQAGAQTLIHGHTHRPAEHQLGEGRRRIVLSDWDLRADPPRAEVLRLTAGGASRLPV